MKTLRRLEKNTEIWFLIFVSFFFFLLRLPSLFEPLWYGDEGIYEVLGMGLNHGRILYRDIWDNKPPLIYVLYAIFQANQPLIRLVSLIGGLISVILFYFLSKKLFHKQSLSFVTTSIFSFLLAIPLLEGNIANAENFMMPLTLGAALLILNTKTVNINSHKNPYAIRYVPYAMCGLLLGIAFLFKVVAIFDLAAFTLFLVYTNILLKGQRFQKSQKSQKGNLPLAPLAHLAPLVLPLFIGFLTPFLLSLLFFTLNFALGDYIHSAFLSNVGYVNYGNQFRIPFSNLVIPQGFLIVKLILLACVCCFLFVKRNSLSKETLFILLWLSFAIFSALFSQRPYTHYLLVLLSSLCLFMGLLFKKTKMQSLLIGVGFLILIYFLTNFNFYSKTVIYYQNFIAFLDNSKNVTQYREFFDGATPRDYALAEFLRSHMAPEDNLFIWGNNAQLYVLAQKLPPGRYSVTYHITASKETIAETEKSLENVKPKYIVIMPNQPTLPYSLLNYSERLRFENATIYERDF